MIITFKSTDHIMPYRILPEGGNQYLHIIKLYITYRLCLAKVAEISFIILHNYSYSTLI